MPCDMPSSRSMPSSSTVFEFAAPTEHSGAPSSSTRQSSASSQGCDKGVSQGGSGYSSASLLGLMKKRSTFVEGKARPMTITAKTTAKPRECSSRKPFRLGYYVSEFDLDDPVPKPRRQQSRQQSASESRYEQKEADEVHGATSNRMSMRPFSVLPSRREGVSPSKFAYSSSSSSSSSCTWSSSGFSSRSSAASTPQAATFLHAAQQHAQQPPPSTDRVLPPPGAPGHPSSNLLQQVLLPVPSAGNVPPHPLPMMPWSQSQLSTLMESRLHTLQLQQQHEELKMHLAKLGIIATNV